MKTLTIRGVDENLFAQIKRAAREESLSVNQYLINLFKQQFAKSRKQKLSKKPGDLKSLFGQCSEDEYRAFKNDVESQRKIDPELWQ